MHTKTLADRMKLYEEQTDVRLLPMIPVIARIDGREFHSFTKNMEKPFDSFFMSLMQDTTKFLIEETHAVIGYTQSDEITLVWHAEEYKSEIFFDSRVLKMCSVLASLAAAKFNRISNKSNLASFDCRVFNVPSKQEAVNCLIWREEDAVKNSIFSVARSRFSHKELHGKNGKEMQEMLWQKYNINWNDYPNDCKKGTYFRKRNFQKSFTPSEIAKLPAKHPAKTNAELEFTRSEIIKMDIPPLKKTINAVDVIFFDISPNLKTESE
jgi:tRNA(His) 5'-end guanylyltransferase